MPDDRSLATAQRPVGDSTIEHPLAPPLTRGCPTTGTEAEPRPLEISYDYQAVDRSLFDGPPEAGHERWAPLLPPLASQTAMGEGATPLVALDDLSNEFNAEAEVYLKDESQNPTWSHKDRANRCMVSAAIEADATGVVASSTGNHGASAAAYASRVGLPSVILMPSTAAPAMQTFVSSYGATVVRVADSTVRQRVVDHLATEHDHHPLSSRTAIHTGHPYGPEGYKPIAYETYLQLDRTDPDRVYVPTGHAELLYGVWKGFRELDTLEVAEDTPHMVACEPAAVPSLATAIEADEPISEVPTQATTAVSIGGSTSSHRGYLAVTESDGWVRSFDEATLDRAQSALARAGHWQERSGAAGYAGLIADLEARNSPEGPVVCLGTSSGFKDGGHVGAPLVDSTVDAVLDHLGL